MKTKRITILALCLMLVMAAGFGCTTGKSAIASKAAPAGTQSTVDWKYHDTVDVDFVAQYARVPMPENSMLIDARPKRAKYDRGHIPMAVSIPWSQFDKMVDKLPADKSALLIYYCGGLKCKLSHKSAKKAVSLGYTNVKVFAEGFPEWMSVKGHYSSVSVEWVKKQVDTNTDMVLIDARPKRKKYDKGHIPTAISMPTSQFDKMKAVLPAEKDKPLVFYCGGFKCKLSHKSAAKAIALGYTNVKVYAAGYPAWKKYVGATAMAKPKAGSEEGSINIEEFKKIIKERPESIYLVYVRDTDEFEKGSFKTAVHIPVDDLEAKIKDLPQDKPIVFVCGTGARSGESYYMVQDIRPELKNIYYLDGELTIHKDGTFTIKKPVS